VFDFHRCTFFDGNMTAPLQATLEPFLQRNTAVRVRFESLSQDVEHALRQNQFLAQYGYKLLPDYDGTSLPLRHFYCADMPRYYHYLGELVNMIDRPQMTLDLTKEFKKSLLEVMANACEHARSPIGFFCCAQYFPSDQKIRFSFSDGGVGFRQNVTDFNKQHFTDIEAIEWAIKNGNSTKSKPGGLGLDIVRQFVTLNGGRLCVISGKGFCSIVPEESPKILRNSLRGTTIHFEINTADTKSYYLGTSETA
jgi:hypothetical protein